MAARRPITIPAYLPRLLPAALIAAVILGASTFGHPAIWRADPNTGGGQWDIGAYDRCLGSIDDSSGNTIVGNTVGNTVGSGNTFGNTVAFNTIGNTIGVTNGNTSGPWTSGEIKDYRAAQIWCCIVSGGQWGNAQAKCVAPPA